MKKGKEGSNIEFQQQQAKHDAAAFKAAFPGNNNPIKGGTNIGEQ